MSEHTPAPWEWVDSLAWGYSALWNPETRQEVLVPGGRNDGDTPETWMGEELTDADKTLIAAAPALYDALIALSRSDGFASATLFEEKESRREFAKKTLRKAGLVAP